MMTYKAICAFVIINSCICFIKGAFPPTINKFPENDNTLKIGEDFTLSCKDNDELTATTIWFKGQGNTKQRIIFGVSDRVITNANQDLIFVNPQPEDGNPTGFYTCSVENDAGTTELGYDLKVTLAYFEDEFRYTPRDNFFYDIAGSNLAWANCLPPKAHPEIVAYYINGSSGERINLDDTRITLRQLIRKGTYTQIIIENATQSDAGTWQCVAKHPTLGEKRYDFTITYYGPPPGPKNLRIKESRATSVVLNWDFVRNDLQFYDIELTRKDDGTKTMLKMLESKSPRLSQILEFEVKRLDAGKDYIIRMRATDQKEQVGAWSAPFNFKSVTALKPVLVEDPKKLTRVGEKKSTTIQCRIDGLPLPTFKWFKDGKELVESEEIVVKSGLLTLKNVKRGKDGSEGMYKCKATNKLGSDESNEGELVVEWLDDNFVSTPRTRFFYETDRFVRVSAQPPKGVEPIDILWRQGGKRITKKTHPLFSPTLYNGPTGKLFQALDIRTPTIVQSDVYHVTASNLAKSVSVEFRLIQAPPPQGPPIRLQKTMHGTATISWSNPPTIERIKKLGFFVRNDLSRYDVWYRKESDTTSEGTVVPHYGTENQFRIINLEIDVAYVARVRAVDFGDQIGAWSSFLKFKLDKDLPPSILVGPPVQSKGIENRTHTLPCKVSADKSVVIAWYKDGNFISKTSPRYTYLDDGSLKMTDIQRSMKGVYKCRATTQYGSTESEKGTFNVVYLDSTFVYTRKFTGVHKKKGFTDARVLCIPPKSYPEPVVLWSNHTTDSFMDFSRNNRIKKENKYVRDGVTYYSLVIDNAVELVGQKYGCAVYNGEIGGDPFYVANSEITIYGNPDPPILKYRFSPSKDIILHWESEREDIVNFEVTLKDGSTVVKKQSTSEKEVQFTNLSQDVLYTFVVIAVDVASQRSNPGTITMAETAPSIFKDLIGGKPEIFQGKLFSMSCEFYGYPFPTIKWTKDGQDITNNNKFEFTSANTVLTLNKVDHNNHDGRYQCIATNKVGTAKSTVTEIKTIYTDKTFKYVGTDVKFINRKGLNKVSFGCSPPASYPPLDTNGEYVQWLVNNNPITRQVKRTRVTKDGVEVDMIEFEAKPVDIGVYSCVYPHKAGTRKHEMKLTLKDGPRRPIGLKLKQISWNFFTMSWQHAGDVINGYIIKVTQHNTRVKFANISQTATEYTVENMSPLTQYVFSLESIGKETNSLPITMMVNTTKRPNIGIPSAVVNIQKLNVGSTKATIAWDVPIQLKSNHPNKLKYDVKVCIGTNCRTPVTQQLERSALITQLSPSTEYQIEITVWSELGSKGPSAKDFLKTLDGSAPPAISNFQANPSWNSIIVSWKAPHDTEIRRISYFVLRIYYPGNTNPVDTIVNKDRTSFFFLKLKEGQSYRIGIFAKFNDRDGPMNIKTVNTLDLGTPGIPRSIRVDSSEDPNNANRIAIDFEWELPLELAGNPIDEIQYRIKVCDFGGECETKKTFLRKLKFDNRKAGFTYKYKLTTLRADGGDGESHKGEYNSDIGKISAPISPAQSDSQSPTSTVILSWLTPNNLGGHHLNSISYKIDYCLKQNGIKYACKSQRESGTTTILRGLSSGTNYYVSIRALTSVGEAGVPVEVVVRTEGVAPITTKMTFTTAEGGFETDQIFTTPVPRKTNKVSSGGGGKKEVIVKEALSTGVIIGIVMAVVVILILMSVGVVIFMKKNKSGLHSTGQQKPTSHYRKNQLNEVEMNSRPRRR